MKSGGSQKTVKVSLKENATKILFGPTSAKFAPVFSFLTCNCNGSRGKDYLQRKCTSQDICCCSDNFPQITIFHIFSKSHCALPRSPEADFERHKVAACVGEVFLDDPPISLFFSFFLPPVPSIVIKHFPQPAMQGGGLLNCFSAADLNRFFLRKN